MVNPPHSAASLLPLDVLADEVRELRERDQLNLRIQLPDDLRELRDVVRPDMHRHDTVTRGRSRIHSLRVQEADQARLVEALAGVGLLPARVFRGRR